MRLVRWSSTSLTAVLILLAFSATQATAAGFRLPEAGAKAMGMGFAFTAQADDPSAIYFNPAGLTQLEGQNVMAGVTYIRRHGDAFTGTTPLHVFDPSLPTSETQKDLNFFIPNAYYARKASPSLAYGIGVFVPFGLGLEYKDRENSIFRDQATKVEIMTLVVNPTVAWKVSDVLSVGFGIDFMYGKAKLAQTGVVPPVGNLNIFKLDLEGDGTAWGYNFGILLRPAERVKIGFSYRSPFTLDIKGGDVKIRDIDSTVPFVPGGFTAAQVFGGTSFDTKASTTINMPATAALGAAYTAGRLTLEADLDWTFWSRFKTLVIDIEDNTPLLPDAVRPQNWKDVVAFRTGAEYRVSDPLALRVGFAYDPTPVPAETLSPLLPDADRLNYMVGAGYRIGAVTVDLSYFYVDKKDRTVNNLPDPPPNLFDGTWKGEAHLVALDIGYRF
jgi:long-chain fatty acid transport protein